MKHDPNDTTFEPTNDFTVIALEFTNGAQGIIQVSSVTAIGDRLKCLIIRTTFLSFSLLEPYTFATGLCITVPASAVARSTVS